MFWWWNRHVHWRNIHDDPHASVVERTLRREEGNSNVPYWQSATRKHVTRKLVVPVLPLSLPARVWHGLCPRPSTRASRSALAQVPQEPIKLSWCKWHVDRRRLFYCTDNFRLLFLRGAGRGGYVCCLSFFFHSLLLSHVFVKKKKWNTFLLLHALLVP